MDERNYVMWCTYHNKNILKEYNLYETNHLKLFNNDIPNDKDNINYLHDYLGDLVTYYYVWKNNIKSDIIGFCSYSKHFIDINYEMIDDYGFYPFSGGYFLDALNNNLGTALNRYNHYYYLFLQYMKYKYNINVLNIFNKRKNYLLFFHNMYFFKWKIFEDVCDFVFGFLDYIYPNDQWKKIDNIDLLSNLRHNPINEDVINENKWNWKRHYAVFLEYVIGLYIGLKYNEIDDNYTPNNCPIHGTYYTNFIVCNNMTNDYNEFIKWIKLNIKTGITSFVILSENIDLNDFKLSFINPWLFNINICKNINDYNNKIKELNNSGLHEIKINIDEYIDCESGISMHMGYYNIKKINNI